MPRVVVIDACVLYSAALPDELLIVLLAEDEETVWFVVDELAAGLRNPPINAERLIEGLRAQVPRFAAAHGRLRE